MAAERCKAKQEAAAARRQRDKTLAVNDKLFGPPIKIDEDLRCKLRALASADGPKKQIRVGRKITIQQYKKRKGTERVVTIPKEPPATDEERYLQGSNFTEYEIYQCILAAIQTLPKHIAAAFTIKEYLSTEPIVLREDKKWALNIIGFEPRIPPPIRSRPSFKLVNNFRVPPPASERQHKYWKKHWKKLERIILHRFRIHIRQMLRSILIELAKSKEK